MAHRRMKRNNQLGADYGEPDEGDRPLTNAPDDDFAVKRILDGHSVFGVGNSADNAHYPFSEPGVDSLGNDDDDYPDMY